MAAGIGLAVVAGVLLVGVPVARSRGMPAPALRGLGAAGALVALAAVVFLLVAADETLDATDGPVLAWLVEHRSPGATAVAEAASLVGGTVGTGGLAVLAAVVLAVRGQRGRAAVWVVAVGVGSVTIRGLKVAVERERPPLPTRLAVETSASLPSGHSLMAALGLGLTVAAVLRLLPADGSRTGLRRTVVLVGASAVVLVGASRAYLGVHWTTDVVTGWALGAALLALAVAVAAVLDQRSSEISPPEGAGVSPAR